jgi:hypothetical protein
MSPREERLARNEVLFREVNDRIAELGPGNPDGDFHIVCECATTGCQERLLVPITGYERIREHPRRFFVVPGHTIEDVEDVVERHGSFDVVEKHADVMPPETDASG